ncbi:dipeptidase [Microbacterium paludicola]|uniref:dipeptidase n=1 Tax=Microbacterium paludicola TaxID=300019 RepID=UPI001431CBFA|nr:membrane dipeptidase [Microbacterium paludicola]MBF0817284.1 membrane dipeptidase [Microbacterium paludicola]
MIDGAAPLLTPDSFPARRPGLLAGGLTAVAPTVASIETYSEAKQNLSGWHHLASDPINNIEICRTSGDLETARAGGKLGIILHLQGCDPIEGSIERLREFAAAGVRIMQPTYNAANALGTGSLSEETSGLTRFGRTAVHAMGECGVIPDVSHASNRTALDVLDSASGAVIASHSNAVGVYGHPRNLSDDVIRGIAAHGGTVGVCAFPGFLADSGHVPTVDDLIDHALYVAELVGEQHVALGLDYADEDEDDYKYFGYDPRYYPPLPWSWPTGISSHGELPLFAERVLARGLGQTFLEGILGGNYARVLGAVA